MPWIRRNTEFWLIFVSCEDVNPDVGKTGLYVNPLVYIKIIKGLKESTCNAGGRRRCGLDPWAREDPGGGERATCVSSCSAPHWQRNRKLSQTIEHMTCNFKKFDNSIRSYGKGQPGTHGAIAHGAISFQLSTVEWSSAYVVVHCGLPM